MIYLRSLAFYIFLSFWTVFVFIGLSPTILTFNKRIVSIIGLMWSKGILSALKIICGLSYKVEGAENLNFNAAIIACKHQSMWETVFLTYYLPQAKYILKKELTKIPFYGWYLLISGMIYIDRSLGFSAIKKVARDTKDVLSTNSKVIIFPQGTRVGVYDDKPYQPGIVAIHSTSPDVPIIPCALNSGSYWPKGLALIKSGVITVKFLKPIEGPLKKGELLLTLKDVIDGASLKLADRS